MEIRSYSSPFGYGHVSLKELFDDPVVVQEKIDGSQFSFGRYEGEFKCRSRGKPIDMFLPEKMFLDGINTVKDLDLTDGYTYRGEYLQKPKHNTIKYDRIPEKHVIIYDIDRGDCDYLSQDCVQKECDRLGLETVPLYFNDFMKDKDILKEFLAKKSCLGDVQVEGVVIKNYHKFDSGKKTLMAKLVNEEFRENHKTEWKKTSPQAGDILTRLTDIYRSEVRWNKAKQHLSEQGLLVNAPNDIPTLMKEVVRDVKQECQEEIKTILFNWAWDNIQRKLYCGLPEWYKSKLNEQEK